jgi:predicted HTH transcriptional regulator
MTTEKSLELTNLFQIFAGGNKPYCIKSLGFGKGVYVRIRSTNRRATPDMIAELRRHSRGIAFETEMDLTKNVTDLEEQSLTLFFESIREHAYINDTLSKWRICKNRRHTRGYVEDFCEAFMRKKSAEIE